MQGGENHFQRRFVGEFGMRIDGNTTPVITNRQQVPRGQFELDPAGMPRNGFVHCVIQHFRGQMMQRPFVRAANIHARTPAHRLQAFKNLDILS